MPIEERTIEELGYIAAQGAARNGGNLVLVLDLPWMQGQVSNLTLGAVDRIGRIDHRSPVATARIISMPFLESVDDSDLLALDTLAYLARQGLLSELLDHPAMQPGITDSRIALVISTAYAKADWHIGKLLDPETASAETVHAGTALTPHLMVSIVRTDTKDAPWPQTAEALRGVVAFVEGILGLPLPVPHVVLILDEDAVVKNYAGTNYGMAVGYNSDYEADARDGEPVDFLSGLAHEVAHYFWRGNEGWFDEGLANIVARHHDIQAGVPNWELQNRRRDCEIINLSILAAQDPDSSEEAEYHCNYYLGQLLFQELLEGLDAPEVTARLQALYALSMDAQDAGDVPGIAMVREVFGDRLEVVEKHWSGDLNAPENRPNEGVRRKSMGLVRWEDYPTFDRGTVSFRGTLLKDAVLNQTKKEAQKGGWHPYSLSIADGEDYIGYILPPLEGGTSWALNSDSGSAVAKDYFFYPATNQFKISFPFPKSLGDDPSGYVVVIWGYEDASQKQPRGKDPNILGYARIRAE